MAELQALIFDVDGTLAETEEAHREAFNLTFREFGHPWHWGRPLYKELLKVTGGKERLRHYIERFHPAQAKTLLRGSHVVKLHKRKTEIYTAMARSGKIALRPGVERLLREARADDNMRLAIATTTNIAPLTALFEGTLGAEALDWFDAIAAGDMVSNKKPAPDLFLLALEKLGLPPQNCLALEDSRNGIEAAMAAGLGVVVTKSVYTAEQNFKEALAVLDHLGEAHKPFTPLGGLAQTPGHVDLALLRRWHTAALSADQATG